MCHKKSFLEAVWQKGNEVREVKGNENSSAGQMQFCAVWESLDFSFLYKKKGNTDFLRSPAVNLVFIYFRKVASVLTLLLHLCGIACDSCLQRQHCMLFFRCTGCS